MQSFEAYEDDNGEWRWRLWAPDFELIASSGEAFSSQADAVGAAERVKSYAADATVSTAAGLGMKAARRLRALLAGERGGAARTTQPAATQPARWSINRRECGDETRRRRVPVGSRGCR
jgi:uncharacterized protein YegP (UPF0339 family)